MAIKTGQGIAGWNAALPLQLPAADDDDDPTIIDAEYEVRDAA